MELPLVLPAKGRLAALVRSKTTAQERLTITRVAPAAAIQPRRRRQSSVPESHQPASRAGPQISAASIFTLKATPSSAIAITSDRPRPRNAALAASSRNRTSQESVLLLRSMATEIGVIASRKAAINAAVGPNGRCTSRYRIATEATPARICGRWIDQPLKPSTEAKAAWIQKATGGLSSDETPAGSKAL